MLAADFENLVEKFEHIKEHWDELFLRAKNFWERAPSEPFVTETLKFRISTIQEETVLLNDIRWGIKQIDEKISKGNYGQNEIGTLASQKRKLGEMLDSLKAYASISLNYDREHLKELPGLNRGVFQKVVEILGEIRKMRDLLAEKEPQGVEEIQKIIRPIAMNLNSAMGAGDFSVVVSKMNAAKDDISKFILISHRFAQMHPEIERHNQSIIKSWNELVEIIRRRFVIVYEELAPLDRREKINGMTGLRLH